MPDRPTRAPRPEPPDIVALRKLKLDQPELAVAVDLQLALVNMQRHMQARVPLPWIQVDPAWLEAQQAAGRPLVRFGDIPLQWTDFRLTFRQTTNILFRFEVIERDDHDRIVALGRDGHALEPLVATWYTATSGINGREPPQSGLPDDVPGSLDQVLLLALRPFLARSAESLAPRVDVSAWHAGHCPFCGWEPDFAVILPNAERRLICGRCLAQWKFPSLECPFCANDDRLRITSFASRDGRYRVSACDACKRYLKAYDSRAAPRPVMLAVDAIATLPLDAAAMQRGYIG